MLESESYIDTIVAKQIIQHMNCSLSCSVRLFTSVNILESKVWITHAGQDNSLFVFSSASRSSWLNGRLTSSAQYF